MMDMDEYQAKAFKTAIYPNKTMNIVYPTLGLNGEAGEVAEKVKKMMRDNDGVLDIETRNALIKEVGDVLWYISAIASELNVSLAYVAKKNIEKLNIRKNNNMLKGSGDNRESDTTIKAGSEK